MEHQTPQRQVVAANIRAALAYRRENQGDLAELLGYSPATVSRRMSGELAWNVDELALIAEHLGVAIESLLMERVA